MLKHRRGLDAKQLAFFSINNLFSDTIAISPSVSEEHMKWVLGISQVDHCVTTGPENSPRWFIISRSVGKYKDSGDSPNPKNQEPETRRHPSATILWSPRAIETTYSRRCSMFEGVSVRSIVYREVRTMPLKGFDTSRCIRLSSLLQSQLARHTVKISKPL
ncbi:hypothetical protein P153DRAFT_66562 [Dothidotthia symphoricarpi CBS 119687]|uniref:Uncharacterized protein n=1 Tax=Dothidotthia symphoricarpi CBS 119687 TaxID=1392245 RepID=A0A6A6A5Y4_9PLEO|nr:uncharacterized protein P153DRAFT_66562 [Dothidotthia symphoricarpi CBS 119687]KAF2127392.1 hypothetical protein P153DRAFT_66562 [Dothidotthia symphoricarpi CBS 119687]